jgi:hypothetical protein
MLLTTDEEPEASLFSESYWNKLPDACSSLQRNASEVAAMTLIRLAEFILYHLTILKWYVTAFCQPRLYKAAIPRIHTTVCSPHGVHRATCCTSQQFHASTLQYAAHTVSTVQPAALSNNSTHPHYRMQPTVSTVLPVAFRPQDRERRFFWNAGANLTACKARRPKFEDLALGGRQISSMSIISFQNIYSHL